MYRRPKIPKTVETLTHEEARRTNIPIAAYQSVMREQQNPVRLTCERRNRDLDPQLAWRGNDEQDWSPQPDLFADFNCLADEAATTDVPMLSREVPR